MREWSRDADILSRTCHGAHCQRVARYEALFCSAVEGVGEGAFGYSFALKAEQSTLDFGAEQYGITAGPVDCT